MIDNDNFLVTREVAERTGQRAWKYRTRDGRYIVDRKALGRIELTSGEMVTGLAGVEKITRNEALTLIAKGGYKMGDEGLEQTPQQTSPDGDGTEANTNENEKEE